MNSSATFGKAAALFAVLAMIGPAATIAQTPAETEAYQRGCGGCHTRERSVLRAIPTGSEADRRNWIERFMSTHPCEHDNLKPQIVEYLLTKTRR